MKCLPLDSICKAAILDFEINVGGKLLTFPITAPTLRHLSFNFSNNKRGNEH